MPPGQASAGSLRVCWEPLAAASLPLRVATLSHPHWQLGSSDLRTDLLVASRRQGRVSRDPNPVAGLRHSLLPHPVPVLGSGGTYVPVTPSSHGSVAPSAQPWSTHPCPSPPDKVMLAPRNGPSACSLPSPAPEPSAPASAFSQQKADSQEKGQRQDKGREVLAGPCFFRTSGSCKNSA